MGDTSRTLFRDLRHSFCRALCGPRVNVCSNEDGALDDASFIFVTAPVSGGRVRTGFRVTGCSRTFESNVPWRLLDRDGTELAAGSTMGGGVDGPDHFSFTVDYTISSRQIGHLEVSEEDVSDGEGFPPVRNVIPLVLQP
jgi:hypothetical protein